MGVFAGLLLEGSDFFFDLLKVFFVHSVDKEYAVEVVNLVLNASCQKAVTFESVWVSVEILIFYGNGGGALYGAF